jgi:uncharacterized protein YyaL (SSP411 family)
MLPAMASAQEDDLSAASDGQAVAAVPDGQDEESSAGPIRVRWQEWSRESFLTATRLRRPVMLYLRAEDCRLCQELEAHVLARESVVRKIADTVVPVMTDADLRPDLASRYLTGAVPTVIFLLPNGEPIYEVGDARSLERVGGYFRTPEGMIDYLAQVESYFQEKGKELARKARDVADLETEIRDYQAAPAPVDRVDEIVGKVREGFDFTHGGYGRGWKFIQDAPVRLSRLLAASGGGTAPEEAVAITVRGMLGGEIHDAVDGGFHHYATTREWGVPALEKRLQVNGQALRLLSAAAALAPAEEQVMEALRGTGAFVGNVLARDGGALAFSQQGSLGPADAGSYFAADAPGRATLRPPAVVTRPQAEAMAVAAVGLMEAGAVLQDEGLEKLGLAAVDFISGHLYARGRGVARFLDNEGNPRLRGVLADQVAAMEAFLTAYVVRGRQADLEMALDVLQFCRSNLRRPAGYFIDRVSGGEAVGALRRPLVTSSANGRVALAAFRLAALTGDPTLRDVGLAALGALASAIPRLNHADAAYAEAVMAAAGPQIKVVLPLGADAGWRRAALLLPAPGLAVLYDGDHAAAGASLCRGSACAGPFETPRALAGALAVGPVVEASGEPDPAPAEEAAPVGSEEERR